MTTDYSYFKSNDTNLIIRYQAIRFVFGRQGQGQKIRNALKLKRICNVMNSIFAFDP